MNFFGSLPLPLKDEKMTKVQIVRTVFMIDVN